jgi:lysophospholipase L1-like esterase
MKPVVLTKGMRILFQGDSITDAGRRQGDLGSGFVSMIAAALTAKYPELELAFLNRGISGNRARDLRGRWEADCVDLKPDLLSIMIGINDTWRRFDSNDPTPAERFRDDFHHILSMVKERLNPILVLCEPFVLPYPEDRRLWRDDLGAKIAIVRDLAREFGAILVPFDSVFAAEATSVGPRYWAGDGVHPTHAGHGLMAAAWLGSVMGLHLR